MWSRKQARHVVREPPCWDRRCSTSLSILDLNFSGLSIISGAWIETLSNLHILHPSSLPKVVKRRIKALKNYQVSHTKLEAKFYEEVHQLECKYAKLYEGLYDKVSISSQESIFQFRFQDFVNEKDNFISGLVSEEYYLPGYMQNPTEQKRLIWKITIDSTIIQMYLHFP